MKINTLEIIKNKIRFLYNLFKIFIEPKYYPEINLFLKIKIITAKNKDKKIKLKINQKMP